MAGYSTGLFSCFDDCGVCLLGCCCPGFVAAQTIGNQQPGDGLNVLWCLLAYCCCLQPCAVWVARSRVQEAYNIQEDFCSRFLLWCFCAGCQNCQDAREVNKRRGAK
jgi:Cys-rich protein (TIGR01571 family)